MAKELRIEPKKQGFYWLHPKKRFQDGLKNLETDSDVIEMSLFMNDSKVFNVYAKDKKKEDSSVKTREVRDEAGQSDDFGKGNGAGEPVEGRNAVEADESIEGRNTVEADEPVEIDEFGMSDEAAELDEGDEADEVSEASEGGKEEKKLQIRIMKVIVILLTLITI